MESGFVRPWPAKVFGVAGPDATDFKNNLRPFPYQAFHTPFPGTFDPTTVATSYITCKQTMSPFIREMGATAQKYSWPVFELDAGHCPMITCPEGLTLIIGAAFKQMDTPIS